MVKYLSPIDPHVHLRGEEYSDHNFLELGFRDAHHVGLAAMLEQPNPTPWLINERVIEKRLRQISIYAPIYAPYTHDIKHGIHIGLTNDLEQVKAALESVMARKHGLISDKTFYVHSTGNMGILDPEIQKRIWKMKGEIGYKGVSIGHFEDEAWFGQEFDPSVPLSHSARQTSFAEIKQVEKQISNAYDSKFQGTFYIAHVSNPYTVAFIEQARPGLPFNVVIEATFHHMFLNTEDYEIHGNRVKMNPPLRSPPLQEELLEHVLRGRIDIIGTDHAPHPIERKDSNEPPSGIPALPFWPRGIELLRKQGINEELLESLIFHNSNKIFELDLKPKTINVQHNPDLWDDYGCNPFSRIDK